MRTVKFRILAEFRAQLWPPYGQAIIFCGWGFFFIHSFFFFLAYSQRSQMDVYHTSTRCGLSANLECRFETCCMRLAESTGRKKIAKNSASAHHRTTQVISSQLRHVPTIGKKLVKQQYLLHMTSQYDELRPTNSWHLLAGLGHSSKFWRVSHLGFATAPTLVDRGQPNFAWFWPSPRMVH